MLGQWCLHKHSKELLGYQKLKIKSIKLYSLKSDVKDTWIGSWQLVGQLTNFDENIFYIENCNTKLEMYFSV